MITKQKKLRKAVALGLETIKSYIVNKDIMNDMMT